MQTNIAPATSSHQPGRRIECSGRGDEAVGRASARSSLLTSAATSDRVPAQKTMTSRRSISITAALVMLTAGMAVRAADERVFRAGAAVGDITPDLGAMII